MRIYVASSWKNSIQPQVVARLRAIGYEVHDFKNPKEGDTGFHWSEIDKNWQAWTPEHFRQSLGHPIALDGFFQDFTAIRTSDICVLVMPCGRSAHLEAGYFCGAGKKLIILLSEGEPELMYSMATRLCVNIDEVIEILKSWHGERGA